MSRDNRVFLCVDGKGFYRQDAKIFGLYESRDAKKGCSSSLQTGIRGITSNVIEITSNRRDITRNMIEITSYLIEIASNGNEITSNGSEITSSKSGITTKRTGITSNERVYTKFCPVSKFLSELQLKLFKK